MENIIKKTNSRNLKNISLVSLVSSTSPNHPQIMSIEPGTRLIDFLQKNHPKGFDCNVNYFIKRDGIEEPEEISLEDLDREIKEGEIFIIFLNAGMSILISIAINLAISLILSYLLGSDQSNVAGSNTVTDENYVSVYSNNINQISAKPNGVIPSNYGVNRIYPNLIAPAYKRFENNKEYTYLTTSLGLGHYDILQLYLGTETKVEDLDGQTTFISQTDTSINYPRPQLSAYLQSAFEQIPGQDYTIVNSDGITTRPSSVEDEETWDAVTYASDNTGDWPDGFVEADYGEYELAELRKNFIYYSEALYQWTVAVQAWIVKMNSKSIDFEPMQADYASIKKEEPDGWEETIFGSVTRYFDRNFDDSEQLLYGSPEITQYEDDHAAWEIRQQLIIKTKESDFNVAIGATTINYDENYNNATIASKNSGSGAVTYSVKNLEKGANNITTMGRGALNDNNYNYIVRENSQISNLTLKDGYQEVGFFTINDHTSASSKKINKIEVDVSFQSGLYSTNSSGEFQTAMQSIKIYLYGYDIAGNPTVKISKDFYFSGNSKTNYRETVSLSLPDGYYKIKIRRNTESSSSETKLTNDPTIVRVKAFEIEENTELPEMSLAIFKIKSSQDLSEMSNLSLNTITRRLNTKETGPRYLLTLRDMIEDIWMDNDYGFGQALNLLDFRSSLNENCNIILDSQENGYGLISDVLKGFGYNIYPLQFQLVIDKDQKKDLRSYVFTENNSKDYSLNWNISDVEEIGDGIKVNYMKQGELKLSSFTYPTSSKFPTEHTLRGLMTETQAKKQSFYLYNKAHIRSKSLKITTELEGYIPELGSLIGFSRKILNGTYSLVGLGTYYEEIEQELKTLLRLSDYLNVNDLQQEIDANNGALSIQLFYLDGTSSSIIRAIPYIDEVDGVEKDTFNKLILEEDIILDQHCNVSIGKEETFMQDFILESISAPSEENKSITLELTEYKEEVYNEPNI